MSLFKCKMCGGDLEISEGVTVAECEYCGTKQTVPKAMDENLHSLFNRANTLRIKSEFDKAEKLYEKIIQFDSTQSEAYWGLILCKYGIEYVDDPATFKKIPTCHRASYESIIADDDYKSALANADMSQRALYEEQAKEIDRIQKEILALAQKEESYDVFICYKETDASGQRTQDSVIANDIYYQLTNEGFKVFYAAITLEGKLGSAYEPIIFAALNSAKVMLCIGTKPEYFNAVWVKNEWSRFLKIIKKDRSKLLIPCYRDMDAYELPEEFAHLQAQDMSKIGFINDIVRGIKKVVKKDEPKAAPAVVKETVIAATSTNTSPLLRRAFLFLEDGAWANADEYCEKVLDQNPECAEAYLGKLMAELRVKNQEELKNQAEPFDDRNNYQKAIRFANGDFKATLVGYIDHINNRNEMARLEELYQNAYNTMRRSANEMAYKNAANQFEPIQHYKDSADLYQECLALAECSRKDAIFFEAKTLSEGSASIADLKRTVTLLESIPGWKNADELKETCHNRIAEIEEQNEINRKDSLLSQGKNLAAKDTVADLKAAISTLDRIPGWKNADELKESYQNRILEIQALREAEQKDAVLSAGKAKMHRGTVAGYNAAIEHFETIKGWKDADEQIAICQRQITRLNLKAEADKTEKERQAELRKLKITSQRKSAKRLAWLAAPVSLVLVAVILWTVVFPLLQYNNAVNKLEAKYYVEAAEIFEKLDDYKNSQELLNYCHYMRALALMENGSYEDAITIFESLGYYRDSDAKIIRCQKEITYNTAVELMDQEKFDEAIAAFERLDGWKDSAKLIADCKKDIIYAEAVKLMNSGKYEQAIAKFMSIRTHRDSASKIEHCQSSLYSNAISLMNQGKYTEAIAVLQSLGSYKDSVARIKVCEMGIKYDRAVSYMNMGNYTDALSLFRSIKDFKDSTSRITTCEKEIKYSEAVTLMNQGKYTEAITVFKSLGSFEDSATKLSTCQNHLYNNAVSLMNQGKYTEAITVFKSLGSYKDSVARITTCQKTILRSAKVGDHITFGSYEQDNNVDNGYEAIEWIVLDIQNGKMLVISQYALDYQPFHTTTAEVTWETCSLRTWLNNTFYLAAFSSTERNMILTSSVPAADPYSSNATRDKLFLVDSGEIDRSLYGCKPTRYTVNKQYGYDRPDSCNYNCSWWARSVTFSKLDGQLYAHSFNAAANGFAVVAVTRKSAVRPAMWIDIP